MKIAYTRKDYRKMIRGEISFDELTDHALEHSENVSLEGPDYEMTFEDFLHALRILNGKPVQQVSGWLDTLVMESGHCGFSLLLEYAEDADLVEELYHSSFQDFLTRKGVLRGVCSLLFQYFDHAGETDPSDLSLYISILSDWKYNQGKPVDHWRLNDVFKKKWLKQFDFEDDLKNASEEEVRAIRRWTDDLVKQNDEDALWFKAFAMYGGNHVYPENWKESERLLEKLVSIHQNPWAANALGYIYVLGRAGKTDYDRAAEYFTMGAVHQITESTYQLGDLFLEGKGVPQDAQAALQLYSRAYLDSLSLFLAKDWDNRFADAAFRLGRTIQLSRMDSMDMAVYGFYLKAECAIHYRMKYAPSYGDEEILEKIEGAVSSMKQKLGKKVQNGESAVSLPDFIREQPSDGGFYEMKVHLSTHDKFTMQIRKAESSQEEKPVLSLLAIVPEMTFCAIREQVVFHGNQNSGIDQEDDVFCFDEARVNADTKQLEFLLAGGVIRSYENVPLVLKKSELEKSTRREDELLRFACVDADGTLYNARCSDRSIQRWSRVLVTGKNMHAEGTVKRIFERKRSDMPGREKDWLKAQPASHQ